MLPGYIQEQKGGEIRIEPTVTICFHNRGMLAELGHFLNPNWTIVRTFKSSTHLELGRAFRNAMPINGLCIIHPVGTPLVYKVVKVLRLPII